MLHSDFAVTEIESVDTELQAEHCAVCMHLKKTVEVKTIIKGRNGKGREKL